MKKIRLNLEDLAVESFDTTPEEVAGSTGTVYAYESTGSERICSCNTDTDCDTCSSTCDCGGGGGDDTSYDTCATGTQRLCECY